MAHSARKPDTSGELIIQRWGNGIKLIRPDHLLTDSDCSVANVLKLPFNICFLNTESVLQNMSEACVETCGMDSVTHFIGKTALDFTSRKQAECLFTHDKNVLTANKIRIFDEEFVAKKHSYHFISIKSPWYNPANEIIGIFNCAIALGKQELEGSLAVIAKLGLLDALGITSKKNQVMLGSEIENVYLTNREIQCLRLHVRGQSAKEIAMTIGLSRRTVEHYLENIKKKLRVSSKTELIQKTIDYFA
jgi:DNA-binding CsgD family transcriptional regulator